MGFWGTLGKLGMGFATGGVVGLGTAALGSVLNKKKSGSSTTTPGSSVDDSSKLLTEQGSKMFGASEPAFEQALGQYGKLASGDKDSLAAFTGTGVNELNRTLSRQTSKAGDILNRGGALAKVQAEAPGQLESQALGLRLGARTNALDKLGSLGLAGSQAGNQAVGQAGNLKLGQGQLDLQRRGQNIGIANDIGQGVGAVLDKTGVWDKLGKSFGNMFGGGGGNSGAEM